MQALAGLSATAVAGTVFGVIELAHGRALEGALGLILALTSIPIAYATWSMRRTAVLHRSQARPESTDVPARLSTSTSADHPTVEDATVWWYWVRAGMTTTHYSVSDAEGEWVGEFDRRGARGYLARAQDLDRDRFVLSLGRGGAEPRAVVGRDVVARIVDDRLQVDGRWLEVDLPRDAQFSCAVRHGTAVLLRVSRWPNGPFARVELATGLPEPSVVTLLVLFVLTCDHDLANTIPGG